jgi:tetratricopeptide (TPR) repeat protein
VRADVTPATLGFATFPAPHSTEELELLVAVGHNVRDFARLTRDEQDALLAKLEAYECHGQVATLLKWRMEYGVEGDEEYFDDSLWLLRVQFLGLERLDDFIATARSCVARLKLPFATVRLHVADGILGEENWIDQAQLYRSIVDNFVDNTQKVILLERLALIYEKKLFLENEVEPVFNRILQIDQLNVKARRFYKLWYMQSLKWKEVGEQLEALITASRNANERQRAAHELAQLYLYNLNDAERARDILQEYCADSQLDIRQTLVEALERLERYDELLETLGQAEALARDQTEIAALKLKQGLVSLKAGNPARAVDYLREGIVKNPQLLLAYEALVTALIDAGRPAGLLAVLEDLKAAVSLDASKSTLEEFIARARRLQPHFNG